MNEVVQHMKFCLQLLALPVTGQIRLYPGDERGVAKLNQTFEELHLGVSYMMNGKLTPEQASALAQVRLHLCHLNQHGNTPVWSDIALRTSVGWRQVRKSARRALAAFGWSLCLPPTEAMKFQRIGVQRDVQWQDVRYAFGLPHQNSGPARPEVV